MLHSGLNISCVWMSVCLFVSLSLNWQFEWDDDQQVVLCTSADRKLVDDMFLHDSADVRESIESVLPLLQNRCCASGVRQQHRHQPTPHFDCWILRNEPVWRDDNLGFDCPTHWQNGHAVARRILVVVLDEIHHVTYCVRPHVCQWHVRDISSLVQQADRTEVVGVADGEGGCSGRENHRWAYWPIWRSNFANYSVGLADSLIASYIEHLNVRTNDNGVVKQVMTAHLTFDDQWLLNFEHAATVVIAILLALELDAFDHRGEHVLTNEWFCDIWCWKRAQVRWSPNAYHRRRR